MKTESVIDGMDYTEVELRSSLKCEDLEEKMEMKKEHGLDREEEVIIFNIKEEEEDEGWERPSEEMKSEDGVRDEEIKEPDQKSQMNRGMKNGENCDSGKTSDALPQDFNDLKTDQKTQTGERLY
ncbi:hypothetical protein AAFF_G00400030, partial [Aldrovandia affinis]